MRPDVLGRPGLVERLCGGLILDGSFTRRLSLISAPAGFGKTTLAWLVLRRCLCVEPTARVAWLSLEAEDRDPGLFLAHLRSALGLPDRSGQVPAEGEGPVTALLNELAEAEPTTIIVLDDYQHAACGEVDRAFAFLLDHLPPRVHAIITTRVLPDLPLPRLRARGQMAELDARDLRFDEEEAKDFLLRLMGLRLGEAEVAALEARTEGWAAGLQLAALSLRGRADAGPFIESFAGSHRHVLDYLVDEVLLREPADTRDFLLRTSILDQLCVPLCEAITGSCGQGRKMLDRLEEGNLFLVALDERREWYRYHALFAEALRSRLADERPGEVAGLHRLACEWHAREGHPAEAIRHAFSAGDLEGAARLIELCWHEMDTSYQAAPWLEWAKRLPAALVRSRPVLCAGLAWALLDTGKLEESEEWFVQAGDPPEGFLVSDEAQYRALPSLVAAGRAYRALALGDVALTVTEARKALALAPEGDRLRRMVASALLGLALYAEGDLGAAEDAMCASMSLARDSGRPSDALGMTFLVADIRTTQGRLHDAERAFKEALLLGEAGNEASPAVRADLHRGMGEVLLERGDLEGALEEFRKGRELGEGLCMTDWRYRISIAEARAAEAQGDLDAALAFLDEAERFHVRTPLPDARPLDALRARIWIRQGEAARALAWATDRGLAALSSPSFPTEARQLSLARAMIARAGEEKDAAAMEAAVNLLQRLLASAETGARRGSAIEILVLLALAQEARGDGQGAAASLERALSIAEPQGHVQVFLGEGQPLMALLARLARRLREGPSKAHAARLLAILARREARPSLEEEDVPVRLSAEPLSGRELEVLKLLATDLSGPEVARELYISLNTLRTHTKNIYDKLGVNSRRAAVSMARTLGLR
jgi:LuxR family maltose regulon positive regulatory protein